MPDVPAALHQAATRATHQHEPGICIGPGSHDHLIGTYLDPPNWRVSCQPQSSCSQCSLPLAVSAAARMRRATEVPSHEPQYDTLDMLACQKFQYFSRSFTLMLCDTDGLWEGQSFESNQLLLIYHRISMHQRRPRQPSISRYPYQLVE